jgi:hypothetical protein
VCVCGAGGGGGPAYYQWLRKHGTKILDHYKLWLEKNVIFIFNFFACIVGISRTLLTTLSGFWKYAKEIV